MSQLTPVFQEVFEDDELEVTRETTAHDIEDWDSIMHVALLLSVESAFGVRFNSSHVSGLKNVGQLADMISSLQGAR